MVDGGVGQRSIIIIRKMMWSLLWWRRRTRIRLNFFLLFLTTGQILEWSVCTTFFLRLYWPRDILLLLLWCVNPNKAKWNMTESCTKGYWVWAWVVNYYLLLRVSLSLDPMNQPYPTEEEEEEDEKSFQINPQKVFRKISTCNNCRRSPFMGAYGLHV